MTADETERSLVNMNTANCPCHSSVAAHEAYVAAFVASLLDGSRYAALSEADDYEGGVDEERALEVR